MVNIERATKHWFMGQFFVKKTKTLERADGSIPLQSRLALARRTVLAAKWIFSLCRQNASGRRLFYCA